MPRTFAILPNKISDEQKTPTTDNCHPENFYLEQFHTQRIPTHNKFPPNNLFLRVIRMGVSLIPSFETLSSFKKNTAFLSRLLFTFIVIKIIIVNADIGRLSCNLVVKNPFQKAFG